MNVLYVTANPKPEANSYSLQVGRALVEAVKQAQPEIEVVELNLFEQPVPEIDGDVLAAWGALQEGKSFAELTASQQAKVGGMNAVLEQFLLADRIIFATPMWNFGFPPRFKAFIDAIIAAGRTFKYTENGPVGLVEGKKLIHIIASGGIYSHGPASAVAFSDKHVRGVLGFIGVKDVQTVWVEGTAMVGPAQAEEIKEAAIAHALELVGAFLQEAVAH